MKKILVLSATVLLAVTSLTAQSKNNSYKQGYRADAELSTSAGKQWAVATTHGYSFGNGLFVGGGVSFAAEYQKAFNGNPDFVTPIYADLKYTLLNCIVSPFIDLRAGQIIDITNRSVRYMAVPSVGFDIANISISAGCEFQKSFKAIYGNVSPNRLRIAVGLNF